jgi:hypothetical protein
MRSHNLHNIIFSEVRRAADNTTIKVQLKRTVSQTATYTCTVVQRTIVSMSLNTAATLQHQSNTKNYIDEPVASLWPLGTPSTAFIMCSRPDSTC